MKLKRSNIFWNALVFLTGVMTCYICAQYRYLQIDTEINVWETIIALMSIVVGLYIAVSLQKKFNQNQNLYNFLISRLDTMWSAFNSLYATIEASDQIEHSKIITDITELQKKNREFTKLLEHLDQIPNEFETLSDKLQGLFETSNTAHNIIDYTQNKQDILNTSAQIVNNFIEIFNKINEKV